jgi:hypothetical protein
MIKSEVFKQLINHLRSDISTINEPLEYHKNQAKDNYDKLYKDLRKRSKI